jgi:hypothetical protein
LLEQPEKFAQWEPTVATVQNPRSDAKSNITHQARVRGYKSRKALNEQLRLPLPGEEQGLIERSRLPAVDELPTFFTRVPLFAPGFSRSQRALIEDARLKISTSWGSVIRNGPALTIYDEDTLYALVHLRDSRIVAPMEHLPSGGNGHTELAVDEGEADPRPVVHWTRCLISDIQRFLGRSDGGRSSKDTLESIKRIARTSLEFETEIPHVAKRGGILRIFDVLWDCWENDSVIFAQFSPVIAKWLEKDFTYIDWSIRRQLTDTGKAVHRFLSSQPRVYSIGCIKLQETVFYMRDFKSFMRDLRSILTQLEHIGWVKEFEISGTGRKTPYVLHVVR